MTAHHACTETAPIRIELHSPKSGAWVFVWEPSQTPCNYQHRQLRAALDAFNDYTRAVDREEADGVRLVYENRVLCAYVHPATNVAAALLGGTKPLFGYCPPPPSFKKPSRSRAPEKAEPHGKPARKKPKPKKRAVLKRRTGPQRS